MKAVWETVHPWSPAVPHTVCNHLEDDQKSSGLGTTKTQLKVWASATILIFVSSRNSYVET